MNIRKFRSPNRNLVKRRLVLEDLPLKRIRSKFDLNPDYDTNKPEDETLTDTNEYNISPEKTLDSEDGVEFRKSKKFLYVGDFEL